MKSFFKKLTEGDKAVSSEHGLVDVISIEVRDNVKFVTCNSIPNETDSEDDIVTFDAVEGELYCPKNWQISSSITACEVRIDNGMDSVEAFNLLRQEVEKANNGEFIYKFS